MRKISKGVSAIALAAALIAIGSDAFAGSRISASYACYGPQCYCQYNQCQNPKQNPPPCRGAHRGPNGALIQCQ